MQYQPSLSIINRQYLIYRQGSTMRKGAIVCAKKTNWASVCAKKRTVQSELNFCAQAKLTLQTFDTHMHLLWK